MGDWPARFLVFAENVDDVGVDGFRDDRDRRGDRGDRERCGLARDSAPLKAAGGACNGEGETVGRQGGDEGGDRFVICRGPCCRGGASGVDRDEQGRRGKGGDELALAALSSLDEAKYNAWLETVKQNPQVIEIEVQGIWTLIDDAEKARALMEAYKEAYTFSSVSAVVNLEREIYFLRDDDFFTYHLDEDRSSAVRPLAEMWPSLAAAEFTRIDAAFGGKGMVSPDGEDLRNKLYFFRRHRFVRFDVSTGKVDPGYPKTIAEGWPGVPFERIDAALSMGPDSVYLFYGQQYVRFSLKLGRVEEGYPASVAKRWLGLNYDRIDAAIYWGNAKVYFFIEDQYVRYDMVNFRADPGYPKYLVGRYVEDWKFFD